MQGPVDEDWDVNDYFSPHEPKHHWELRKKFMEQNKGRYPKERLVCLAQVFANSEFMGCRYPKETMEEVEELAYGIVQEYRESQKNRLQRTFVSGSAAASGKVNRVQKRKIPYENKEASEAKSFKGDLDFIIVRLDYEKEENACNVLNRSASFCKSVLNWDIKCLSENEYRCTVNLRNEKIHSAIGNSKNEARDRATHETLEMLSKKCYTILVKSKFLSEKGETIDAKDLKPQNSEKTANSASSGIGHKLLKMMGWTGGGLGKGGSGISEPITAQTIVNREGLGTKSASTMFKKQIRQIIEEYAASTNPYDLVFTSGFDNDQRKEMHLIAKRLGLRSKSFGKNEDRFITISRKFDAQQLIDELVRHGGSTEKYDLIAPKE